MRHYLVLTIVMLAGCASAPRDVVALSGTVESVREAGATPGKMVQAPVNSGAVGGAMVGLLAAATYQGPFHIYKIRMLDGQYLEVPAYVNVATGACIDVLVEAGKSNIYSFWTANDITMRPSMACQK